VLDDRATDGTPELAPQVNRDHAPGCGVLLKLSERVSRLGPVAAAESKSTAVEVVAAGLGLGGHYAGDGFAKFRVVVLRGDFRLGDGIQVGVDDNNTEDRILVIRSVQLVSRAAEVLAIDEDLLAALRVLRLGMGPTDQLLGSGREQLKLSEVAVVDGKVFDRSLVKDRCHVSAVSLQFRRLGRDLDGFLGSADLVLSVDARSGISRYLNIG